MPCAQRSVLARAGDVLSEMGPVPHTMASQRAAGEHLPSLGTPNAPGRFPESASRREHQTTGPGQGWKKKLMFYLAKRDANIVK